MDNITVGKIELTKNQFKYFSNAHYLDFIDILIDLRDKAIGLPIQKDIELAIKIIKERITNE